MLDHPRIVPGRSAPRRLARTWQGAVDMLCSSRCKSSCAHTRRHGGAAWNGAAGLLTPLCQAHHHYRSSSAGGAGTAEANGGGGAFGLPAGRGWVGAAAKKAEGGGRLAGCRRGLLGALPDSCDAALESYLHRSKDLLLPLRWLLVLETVFR